MKHHLLALALASAAATTSLEERQQYENPNENGDPAHDYILNICAPVNSQNAPDLSAPCILHDITQLFCIYGPSFDLDAWLAEPNVPDALPTGQQGPVAQRDCVCQSNLFPLIDACSDCFEAHGGSVQMVFQLPNRSAITGASSSYCAASYTPTGDWATQLYDYANSAYPDGPPATTSGASSSLFLDPVGNRTAVSYYYTPSITGTAAYVPVQPTGRDGNVTFSSLNTVSGQIRPTAVANVESGGVEGSSAQGSGSSSTDSGARETGAVKCGGVGMLGFAAAVALL